ncbi:hypothetical protein DL96DRAFT_1621420 [Flagelloscypha sp. PMI_526]|nr:hypothetical protein DL96DRAFT_1621420 [Flagelloscypha sp. PMI_526]
MTSSLPLELLEHILAFLSDDLSTLAACSSSSSVLLPACRAVRFHTVTLRAFPLISNYVHRVHILDPQSFQYGSVTMTKSGEGDSTNSSEPVRSEPIKLDTGHILLKILSKLANVRDILLSSEDYLGILWPNCLWLQDSIVSLPSLQTITTEVWSSMFDVTTWPCFHKIRGLGCFSPIADNDTHGQSVSIPDSPLQLSTFRISSPDSFRDVETFVKSATAQCIDLSSLRNLAIRPSYSATMRSWLIPLASKCAKTLENLTLELDGDADDDLISASVLPNVKTLWLVVHYMNLELPENRRKWASWLTSLLYACSSTGLEVVFFISITSSQLLGDLLRDLITVLEGKKIAVSHWKDVIFWSGLPDVWNHLVHQSNEIIWTAFYKL